MSLRLPPALRLLLLCGLAGLHPACQPARAPVHSVSSLGAALARAGWDDVTTMHVQSDALSSTGIVEAALLADGDRRLEVYQAAHPDQALEVAGIFASSGDPVFVSGALVVVIPAGIGEKETARMLEALGFSRRMIEGQ